MVGKGVKTFTWLKEWRTGKGQDDVVHGGDKCEMMAGLIMLVF
jgi:hypothetical protein